MPLALFCNNTHIDSTGRKKKCGQVEPFLDPKTDIVYCPLCENEMPNITHFTKTTLKNLKRFRQKQPVAFGVKCQNCGKEARPKLTDDDLSCPNCNQKHQHLSEPFKMMLKNRLKAPSKDI